jgi:hypothetical protein
MTREGWRPVVAAYERGPKEVIERFGIVATPDHHIFTVNRGWVSLDCLSGTDMVGVWITEKPWLWTGSDSIGTQPRRGDIFGSTTGVTEETPGPRRVSIATFGEEKGGTYPWGTSSTTEMEIAGTTISRTSGAFQRGSTRGSTAASTGHPSGRRSIWSISRESDSRLPSGTVLLRDEPGTGKA